MAFISDFLQRGTHAARLALTLDATQAGFRFFETDTLQEFGWDGSGWYQIGTTAGGTPHDLLDGTLDQDTVAGSVVAGDVIVGNTTPKWSRLAVGTPGQLLSPRGSPAVPNWEDELKPLEFIIDGGGATITTGLKGYLIAEQDLTIAQVTLLGDQTGSIEVDLWKCTYADFDAGGTHPVVGDSIVASAPPTITSDVKSQDSTLTGWTTALAQGDIIAYNVNSVTTFQRVTISLRCKRA